MEFASMSFIWLFLPIVLIVYYGLQIIIKCPQSCIDIQNAVMLFFSFLFYAWVDIESVPLVCILITGNYFIARMTDKADRKRKLFLLIGILFDCGILFYFKYFNMVVILCEIRNMKVPAIKDLIISLLVFQGNGSLGIRKVLMPVALSFIIFQLLSYIIDVYRKKIHADTNIANFGLYIMLFPQLIQGPIMRYSDLGSQIRERTLSTDLFCVGIERFCFGLGKKVIIANTLGNVSDRIWSMEIATQSTIEAWFGIILYTFQIYYDFSGYSDMAVGLGKMFGFTICENFNYPYIAHSVQDFWRRWHMSLSHWFRDYIYIPLGGNRTGKARMLINISIVFFVTGIWHGANLNFVVWGLYFAFFSVVEHLALKKWIKHKRISGLWWIYTVLVVMFGWVLFRSPNLYYAIKYFQRMFSWCPAVDGSSLLCYMNFNVVIALVFAILSFGWIQELAKKYALCNRSNNGYMLVRAISSQLVFIWSILLITGGSYNPSIYGAF